MRSYTLEVPFLTDDPEFARGVEFGLLYARMQDVDEGVIEDYFLRTNQEQILLLANRLGWRVKRLKKWDQYWFFCRMEKTGFSNSRVEEF